MSLATPTVAVTDWIAALLTALPALAGVEVFVAVADNDQPRPVAGAAGPYFTLRHLGSVDHLYLGGGIAGTTSVIEVAAWDEGTDATRLAPLVAAAHGAIHAKRGTSGDVAISSCVRQAPVERTVIEGDRPYTQLGGEYRVRASAG